MKIFLISSWHHLYVLMKYLFYRKFISMWCVGILWIVIYMPLSASLQHLTQCFLLSALSLSGFPSTVGNKQLITDTLVFQRCGGLHLSRIHIFTLDKMFSSRSDVDRSLATSRGSAVAQAWRCCCYLGREIRYATEYWKWINLYNMFVNSPKGQ